MPMMRRTLLLAAAGVPLAARAHHGWSSFDPDRPIYLEGTARQVKWRNPHAEFTLEGDRFRSAEHFMMAEKARLFGDEEIRAQMLVASTPDQVKKLGRRVRNFNEALWTAERFDIVRRGNIAKFGQNPGMRNFLLGTGQRILVEASPVDAIWGIGLAATDPRATQPAQWAGLNLLGFALMAAREALRREPAGENATVRGAP